MRIVHINTHADSGGAAKAMARLRQELERQGHHACSLSEYRTFLERNVYRMVEVVRGRRRSRDRWLEAWGQRIAGWLGAPFTRYRSTQYILEWDVFKQADVVNLHNLHGDYFNYHLLPVFSRCKPIIWTLHDMWAMTGHCVYAYDCERWQAGCFDCPLFKGAGRKLVEPPPTPRDWTRQVWNAKQKLYQKSRLYIVTPSQWLCGLAKKSILGGAASIQCIPNGVDLTVFRPIDPSLARQVLGISQDARVILFVAHGLGYKRKGFQYLLDALERIEKPGTTMLLTVGTQGLDSAQLDRFTRRDMGTLADERLMSLIYNAADAFVFPTLADNQPLVLIEAMACGTPMVSFDVGGVSEMVRHMETGYLARSQDAEDMARGIKLLMGDDGLRRRMRQRCQEIAKAEYALELQAQRYLALYEQAVKDHVQSGLQKELPTGQ